MDCSVLLHRHLYSAGSACILLTIIAWVAHRYRQLYLHCSLIYFWVPSSCFCIVISLSGGEIIPFSGVCQSRGRLRYPRRRRRVASRTDWQTALILQPTTTSGNIITQSIIFALAHQLTPSCILHPRRSNITLTHLRVSNCRVHKAVLWHFCRAGLL